MLFSEMSHGMSQIGVPHFMHAKYYSVCNGVDAEAHKITHSRHSYCCCCRRAACCEEDWLDHFEDGSVFGCLFEAEVNPDVLDAAHAGVANTVKARNDKPVYPCENTLSTSTSNSGSLQADQKYRDSTWQLCLNVSQHTSGSGQSTSSCEMIEERLDITQENIRLKLKDDTVLTYLLQWKRDGEKPTWSTVAP